MSHVLSPDSNLANTSRAGFHAETRRSFHISPLCRRRISTEMETAECSNLSEIAEQRDIFSHFAGNTYHASIPFSTIKEEEEEERRETREEEAERRERWRNRSDIWLGERLGAFV